MTSAPQTRRLPRRAGARTPGCRNRRGATPAAARRERARPVWRVVACRREIDAFDEADTGRRHRRRQRAAAARLMLGSAFFAALGVLVSLAVGLWVDS